MRAYSFKIRRVEPRITMKDGDRHLKVGWVTSNNSLKDKNAEDTYKNEIMMIIQWMTQKGKKKKLKKSHMNKSWQIFWWQN